MLFSFPLIAKPAYTLTKDGQTIELLVLQRKLPIIPIAEAIIVPVAPDLKMVFGIAKMARDYGANTIQYEANKAAPLAPGQAFIGSGAKYRYKNTVLAVIFDETKRSSPQVIAQAIGSALQLAKRKGAQSVLLPDMTENLLAQPNWITAEQRRDMAQVVARTLVNAIAASRGVVPVVKLWVFDPNNASIYLNELKNLENEEWSDRAQQVLPSGVTAYEAPPEARSWVEAGKTAHVRQTAISAIYGDALLLDADALLRPTSVNLELPRLKELTALSSQTATTMATPAALVTSGAVAVGDARDAGRVIAAGRETVGGGAVAVSPSAAAGTGLLATAATPTPLPIANAGDHSLTARLFARGGPRLVSDVREIGTLMLGDAALTRPGGLTNVDYLIHLACRESNFPAREDAIRSSLEAGLELADEYGLKTLILPNLGGGDNDYPPEGAISLALQVIGEYLNTLDRNTGIEQIYLVADGTLEERTLMRAMERFLPPVIPLPGPMPGDDDH